MGTITDINHLWETLIAYFDTLKYLKSVASVQFCNDWILEVGLGEPLRDFSPDGRRIICEVLELVKSVLATTNFGMSRDRAVGTITDINQLWEMNHMLTLLSTEVSTCSVLATTNFGMSLDRAVGTITDINQLWEHFKGGTLQSGACVGASNADAPKGRSGGVWDHDARAA